MTAKKAKAKPENVINSPGEKRKQEEPIDPRDDKRRNDVRHVYLKPPQRPLHPHIGKDYQAVIPEISKAL